MGDFDATLNGNEQNFHTTIVTLDPLLTQLNGTLAIVYSDTQYSIAAINTNNRQLQPELVSAVSQTDAAGDHLLRQYLVVNPACRPRRHRQSCPSRRRPRPCARHSPACRCPLARCRTGSCSCSTESPNDPPAAARFATRRFAGDDRRRRVRGPRLHPVLAAVE